MKPYTSDVCRTIVLTILTIVLLQNVQGAKRKIPDYVQLCSKSSSQEDLQKCLQNNIEVLKPHLSSGVPEMRLRELDPLFLEKVVLEVPNFYIHFTNLTVRGTSNFQVVNTMLNIEDNYLKMSLNFPSVRMAGDYKVAGKLLVLQLDSKGTTWLNTTNIDCTVEMKGKRREEKGKTYMDFNEQSSNSIQLNIKDTPVIYFNNLFEGNEELTKTMNTVINDNIRDIIQELMPVIDEIIGSIVFSTVQSVFNTFSIDQLFLP